MGFNLGVKLLACVGVVCMLLGCTIGVASLVIWSQNESNPCLGNTTLVSFSYLTWLLWIGISIIAVNGVSIILLMCYVLASKTSSDFFAKLMGCAMLSLLSLSGVFHLAWYVVGGILYFTEVQGSCPAGQSLHDFGLTLFILQSISVGCSCFSSRASVALDS